MVSRREAAAASADDQLRAREIESHVNLELWRIDRPAKAVIFLED